MNNVFVELFISVSTGLNKKCDMNCGSESSHGNLNAMPTDCLQLAGYTGKLFKNILSESHNSMHFDPFHLFRRPFHRDWNDISKAYTDKAFTVRALQANWFLRARRTVEDCWCLMLENLFSLFQFETLKSCGKQCWGGIKIPVNGIHFAAKISIPRNSPSK